VSKQGWLDVAEVVDAQRIFPRLYLMAVSWWYIHLTDWLVRWYASILSADRTLTVNAFALGVLGAASGLLAYSFKIYMAGGRDWTGANTAVVTTVSTAGESKC
jgi:hypothetical protein